ncbi:putative transport protein [Psilocybe cubensis]|uniref:Transport protein n=1 Tax=Psilocybe cubensis TaxID=181762 RepID=A0ACB8GI98_PSICU|nr:putative transport protein [Psilocybe cubensis]KAH9475214.1 putative transport protein [Psilocybe cubensis]
MDVAVIKLHKTDPPVTTFQLILVRMAITFICCMIYMHLAKIPDPLLGPKGVRLWLLMRGIGGFIGLFGIYFSLQYLSLSDATVLTFLSPTTTTVAGAIFLKEKFIIRQAVAGLVSLVGVVLIARPTFIFGDSAHSHEPNGTTPSERLLAVGVSLVGVLGATLAYISIRSIGKRAHTMHIMVYFALQCVVGSTIGMIVTKTPVVIPTQIEWLSLLFMIGVFGFAAQIFLTLGFQREAVGRGTLALYTQIIFASFLEYIVFHTTPSRLSIFGILLIMGSAIYIALTKKPNSPELNSISQPDDEELGRSLLSPNSDTP